MAAAREKREEKRNERDSDSGADRGSAAGPGADRDHRRASRLQPGMLSVCPGSGTDPPGGHGGGSVFPAGTLSRQPADRGAGRQNVRGVRFWQHARRDSPGGGGGKDDLPHHQRRHAGHRKRGGRDGDRHGKPGQRPGRGGLYPAKKPGGGFAGLHGKRRGQAGAGGRALRGIHPGNGKRKPPAGDGAADRGAAHPGGGAFLQSGNPGHLSGGGFLALYEKGSVPLCFAGGKGRNRMEIGENGGYRLMS